MSTTLTNPTATTKRMTYGEYLALKATLRKQFAIRSAMQALTVKARLCLQGKGHNGKSMSQALVDRHLAAR
jgi:hypothetical protein